MSENETHVLVKSTNRGRYCFDDSIYGHDVTSGEPLSIQVMRDLWIDGTVEYHTDYYFISTDGYVVGLFTGMKVRTR